MQAQNTIETRTLLFKLGGLLYLSIIVSGIFAEGYVRGGMVVDNDAALTVENILASTALYRIGFAADTLMLLCDVGIAIVFYRLFKAVNPTLALSAAIFRLIQACILGINLLNYYAALLLLETSWVSSGFDRQQLESLVLFLLKIHSHGYDLALIFFAVSSFMLGYLAISADFISKLPGYGLLAAGLVYLSGSLIRFLAPQLVAQFEYFYVIPLIAELTFCLWLLFSTPLQGGKTRAAS
jgi:hypothetical protein